MRLGLALLSSMLLACGAWLAADEDPEAANGGGGGATADAGGSVSDDDATGGSDPPRMDAALDAGSEVGADADAGRVHHVFVTSALFAGNTLHTYLPNLCGQLAPGRKWIPWVAGDSTSNLDGLDGQGPWFLFSASVWPVKVADFYSELQMNQLHAAIDLNEKGELYGATSVWTGAGGGTCGGWGDPGPDVTGIAGYTDATDMSWQSASALACTELHPVYCFETD